MASRPREVPGSNPGGGIPYFPSVKRKLYKQPVCPKITTEQRFC